MTREFAPNLNSSLPHGSTTLSHTSERMGAFGTLSLNEEPGHIRPPGNMMPNNYHQQPLHVQAEHHHEPRNPVYQQPHRYRPHSRNAPEHAHHLTHVPLVENGNDPRVYQPTVSNADTSDTRRRYDKLSEVYSMSGDTIEFARNLSDYINEKIPYIVTISLLICLCILAFVWGLIGTLNLPFCPAQPMIPIWLMVSALLFIVSAIFRIYNAIPSPRSRTKNLSMDLCGKGVEILFAIANIVWLILGCVWVYGARSYVHFEDHLFQEHYCSEFIYWVAFSTVTGYLLLVCVLIVALICLLVVGSYKETQPEEP